VFKREVVRKLKKILFRSKFLNSISRPRYGYGVEPNQLVWLVDAINNTKENSSQTSGCVVEIGVARGMTSVFLMKHMKDIGDKRKYICIDTFSGFTPEDLSYEEESRGKEADLMKEFTYNDRTIFENNIKRNGFDNFEIYESDAAKFDFSKIPPIDVMLVDVDLYKPSLAILKNSMKFWSKPGYIMVDDVASFQAGEGDLWDGALEAYEEFIAEHKIPSSIVGNKGGIIINS